MDGMILTNDSQKKIVSAINEKIHDYMNFAAVEDGHSLTYVPYFDATLADQQKQDLVEVGVSPQIEELIKNLQLKNTFKQHNNPKAPTLASLIKYVPEKIGKSEILNDIKISALISEFPSMLRMSTWELIYSMNHDGCSMVTFYQKCAQYKTTLLVI